MKRSRAYWKRQRRDRAARIKELASAIGRQRKPESTRADLYAIGSSLCTSSSMIDKAIDILERGDASKH